MIQQPYPDSIGSVVKRIRERDLQLSQADLAWLAGVSRGTISNLETGRVTPDARTWHRIRTSLALAPIRPDDARAGATAQTVLPADAVQGIIDTIVTIRDRDPDSGRRAADRWRRLITQLTREGSAAGLMASAELSWLARDIAPLVPPVKQPLIFDVLRSQGWESDPPPAGSAGVPAPAPGSTPPMQELTLRVNDIAERLHTYQNQAQGLDRVPEEARDALTSGLVITCDVTVPQLSPQISIINLVVMTETGTSLMAQHEAQKAALRWNSILAVATHIVEKQAPDLPPAEIIRALQAGLNAQSPAEVRELIPQARDGDALAMYRLAVLLSDSGRADESERWLRRAAEAGHPGALYTLGKLIAAEGRRSEAEYWLRGAADAGHTDAMYSLSRLLGEEAPRNPQSWLRQAAERGNRDAMYRIWTLLRDLDGPEAELWLRRAANYGHRGALSDLSRLAAERGSEDEAMHWLHRAAQEGDSEAMSRYEVMLYERHLRQRTASRSAS